MINGFVGAIAIICALGLCFWGIFTELKESKKRTQLEQLKVSLLTDILVELQFASGHISCDEYKSIKKISIR